MTNGEKMAMKLFFTENCTNSDFLYKPGKYIFKNEWQWLVFFQNLAIGLVLFAVMDRYFLCMRGDHGNLLESERSGGSDTSVGTDHIPLCGAWGDTFSQIEQGGTVQAFRD